MKCVISVSKLTDCSNKCRQMCRQQRPRSKSPNTLKAKLTYLFNTSVKPMNKRFPELLRKLKLLRGNSSGEILSWKIRKFRLNIKITQIVPNFDPKGHPNPSPNVQKWNSPFLLHPLGLVESVARARFHELHKLALAFLHRLDLLRALLHNCSRRFQLTVGLNSYIFTRIYRYWPFCWIWIWPLWHCELDLSLGTLCRLSVPLQCPGDPFKPFPFVFFAVFARFSARPLRQNFVQCLCALFQMPFPSFVLVFFH